MSTMTLRITWARIRNKQLAKDAATTAYFLHRLTMTRLHSDIGSVVRWALISQRTVKELTQAQEHSPHPPPPPAGWGAAQICWVAHRAASRFFSLSHSHGELFRGCAASEKSPCTNVTSVSMSSRQFFFLSILEFLDPEQRPGCVSFTCASL